MIEQDKAEFKKILDRMTASLGRNPMPALGVSAWWDAMQSVAMTIGQFRAAMAAHLSEITDWPAPASIIQRAGLQRQSPWPSPEVAWNMTPKSEDESGWLCEETAAALGACQDSLNRGDEIGARMAFIEAYKQLPKTGAPRWWISEGSAMSYERRLEAKQTLLAEQPARRLELARETELQRLATTGSQRTGKGLQKLSDLSGSTT